MRFILFRIFGRKKRRIEKLEHEVHKMSENYAKLKEEKNAEIERKISEISQLNASIIKEELQHEKSIAEKNREIESLRMELDILYKHFKLDEEPTQEVISQVRTDKRVHELEMENIELRRKVDWYIEAQRRELASAREDLMRSAMVYPSSLYSRILCNPQNYLPGYWR